MTPPPVRVVTAAESAAADAATIAAGTPGRALMQRAGAAAAAEIVRRYPDHLADGVAVHAGPGNNGGDAWVVARALAAYGVRVAVTSWGGAEPRSADARFERDHALAAGAFEPPTGAERLAVDGVLGTGARPPARDYVRQYVAALRASARPGRVVVALDVPSGLDATTGDRIGEAVTADLTLTFGTLKRGLLVARDYTGSIAVLDIGLDPWGEASLRLYDPAAGLARAIPAAAHKGTRGRVAVVGGAPGMAGAAILAADAALRSGAGMVRALVAPESVAAVQAALPAAMAAGWSDDSDGLLEHVLVWADVVLLGPGLGHSARATALAERLLAVWRGVTVLDADGLNLFAGRPRALADALGGRPTLLTPHPGEFGRLVAAPVDQVLARRFEVGREYAAQVRATVLLKGVPTVVSDPARAVVVAAGTPALATAGSGDALGGIAAALLAGASPDDVTGCAAAAAWAHGRAAELATARRGAVRGTTLADVLDALPAVWAGPPGRGARPPYPVLAELPAVPG